jgi:hypothetical protein
MVVSVSRHSLFRSTEAEVRVRDDLSSTANRLLSGVEGLSFEAGSSPPETADKRSFTIRMPVAGLRSRFQWRFFGVVVADGPSAIVRGAFRLPRFLEIYIVLWLIMVGLFVGVTIAIAAASSLPEMWLLPLGGLVVNAGGYAFLFAARAMAEPALRRVASQLDRCVRPTSGS